MSDSMQTTVLSVGEDGSVEANFTGQVHARGLDLVEATSENPPALNYVAWEDAGGVQREGIVGLRFGASEHRLRLQAESDEGPKAFVQVQSGAHSQLVAFIDEWIAVILEDEFRSSFPKLWRLGNPTVEDVRFNFGFFQQPPMPNPYEVEINHGLGIEPAVVVAINASLTSYGTVMSSGEYNEETANVVGFDPGGGATTIPSFFWFAIGIA